MRFLLPLLPRAAARRFSTAAVLLGAVVALAAPALLTVAGPSATADAAPSANPFAGSYSGIPPGVHAGFSWGISISSKGAVSGSVHVDSWGYYEDGTLTGQVDDAGQMSCRGNWTYSVYFPHNGPGYFTGGRIRFRASVALDGSGNLVGTTDDGTTFTWYRQ